MKLNEAYSEATFQKNGQAVLDLLFNYLGNLNQDGEKTLPYRTPEDELLYWQNRLYSAEEKNIELILKDILAHSVKLHSKKYLGHQTSVVLPAAAITGLFNQLLNNGMGVYEMGMAGNAIEKVVIDLLCKKFQLGAGSGGFITSGGSLGNLTALLSARAAKTSIWKQGHDNNYVALISDQAHYSIERALRIMGFGDPGIIKVPTKNFKIEVGALPAIYDQVVQNKKRVLCMVASAAATNTGSYDDLRAISEFCKKRAIWLHVDAAHGGAVCFSEKYNYLIDGIEHADSIVLDFHKLLLTPALATAVLFKENATSCAFTQQASYLWQEQQEVLWFQSGKRTFECTKHMAGVQFYVMLKLYGEAIFQENVETLYGLAEELARFIKNDKEFELLTEPQSNIVCFRFINTENPNDLNKQVYKRLIDNGSFYLVSTEIDSQFYLRACIMNPLTTIQELNELLKVIRKTAIEIPGYGVATGK